MTIKKATPSSDCSTLSTVTDDDTISTGVVSRVAVEGQQVNPTVRTQEGQLVVPETPLNSDHTPGYISSRRPVDMPNLCKLYREGDQTIIRIKWLDGNFVEESCTMACCIIVTTPIFAIFLNAVGVWYWWLVPFLPQIWLGVLLLFWTTCVCLNSTYITISYDSVKIDYRPMKLDFRPRTTHFKKNGYEEIHVKRTVSTSDDVMDTTITIEYKLHLLDMRTNSFTELKVWHKDLNDVRVALFVAQEIKKYLTSRTGLAASASDEELESV